jgi:hypothetical protein
MGSLLHAGNVDAKLKQLARAVEIKYDSNQPRIPAGNPGGGQWTETGAGSGAGDVQSIVAFAKQKRVAGSPLSYQRCPDLCYSLLERPRHPKSDRNTWDFHKCMNACLQRHL